MQKNLCKENEEMREAYLAKELSPEETARFEAHIEACDLCREALRQELALNTLLDGLSQEVPPELAEKTMLRMRKERTAKKRKIFFRIASTAAMLVLMLTVLYKLPSWMRSFESLSGNNFSKDEAPQNGDNISMAPCETDADGENIVLENINSFFDADGYFLGVPYQEPSGPMYDSPVSESLEEESTVSEKWESALPEPIVTDSDVDDNISDAIQPYHLSEIRCYQMVDSLPEAMPMVLGEYTYHGYTIYAVSAEKAEKLLGDMEFLSEDGEIALIFVLP